MEQEEGGSYCVQLSYMTLKDRELNETIVDNNFGGSWKDNRGNTETTQ